MKSYKKSIMIFFLILLLFPFVKPVGIAIYPTLNKCFQIFKAISICMGLLCIVYLSNLKISCDKNIIGFLGLVLFEIIYIINTVYYGGNCFDIVNNSVTNIILLILIYVFSKSIYKKEFLIAVDILFTFEIILQIISVVASACNSPIFETVIGVGDTYFFGRDNYSAFTLLPMLGIVLYADSILKNKFFSRIKGNILCVLVFATYLYAKSATAACVFLLLMIFRILDNSIKRFLKIFSIKRVIILIVLFLVGVMKYDLQNYSFYFLSTLFGKGDKAITLNSRTIIWECAWKLIKEKPILGWGALSYEQITNYALYGTEHAHNIVLDILLRSGGIGLGSYYLFLVWPCKKIKSLLNSRAVILLFVLVCYLLLSIMDYYPLLQAQYCLLGFLYCWEEFETINLSENGKV